MNDIIFDLKFNNLINVVLEVLIWRKKVAQDSKYLIIGKIIESETVNQV